MQNRPAAPEDIETLEVILTAGCNLRCTYCYQDDKKARRMSWETLQEALDLLWRSRRRQVEVIFLGGEPLLEFPLIRQAVEHIRSKRPRKQVRLSITTNGTLLQEEQASFFARHRFEVRLSFDGVPAAQELRGAWTFPVLDALLERLRKGHSGFFRNRLSVSIALTAGTIPHLAASIAYFLAKGVAKIEIGANLDHDPLWKKEMIDVLDSEFARVYRTCLDHYHRTGDVPLVAFQKHAGENRHQPAGDALCGAPSGRALAVDVDGQAHGCAVFIESYQTFPLPFLRSRVDAMRLGDFRASDFGERLARYPEVARGAGIFHGRREKYSSYRRCGECRYLELCSICPTSIARIPGDTDPRRIPDFPCAYNLVSLKYRDKFPAQPTAVDILTGRVKAYGPAGESQARFIRAGRGQRARSATRPASRPRP